MTRDEFIARWRVHVAGVITLGGAELRRALSGGAVTADTFGKAMLDLTPTTDSLLGRIYDSLHATPPKERANESPQPGAQGSKGPGKGPAPAGPTSPTTAAAKPATATGNSSAGQRS
jgi:hypothetical protein